MKELEEKLAVMTQKKQTFEERVSFLMKSRILCDRRLSPGLLDYIYSLNGLSESQNKGGKR